MATLLYQKIAMHAYCSRFPSSSKYAHDVVSCNLGGGKSIRSRLVRATMSGFVAPPAVDIAPLCAAVELTHAGFLVADDCCDHARHRRGEPTWWTRVGVSNAWNDANMLCYLSKAVVRDAYHDHDALWVLQQTFDEATLRTIVGQQHDMCHHGHGLTMDDYRRVAWLKTGYYTFWLPIVSGVALAARDAAALRATVADIEAMGNALAEIYQSENDMRGVESGDPTDEELGRPTWVAACRHERGAGVDLVQAHAEYTNDCLMVARQRARAIDMRLGGPVAAACLAELGLPSYEEKLGA